MFNILNTVTNLLYGGLGNLAAYLAAHVLLCLLPAFFIAGAMTALIPKEMVTRYLGRGGGVFTCGLFMHGYSVVCWNS